MNASSFAKVSTFFHNLGELADAREELSKYDQIIQFHILGEQTFLIRVCGGEVSSELGEIKDPDFLKVLKIKADAETVNELLDRRLTLGEALFGGKVEIYAFLVKGYVVAWLSKLFQTRGAKPSHE
jgi:hypothetical protein